MGLLDDVASLFGKEGHNINPVHIQAIWEWVQDQGGIEALIQRFQQGGLLAIATSWLSHEPARHPDSRDIQSIFNENELTSLAVKLGTDVLGASGALAKYLPAVVKMFSQDAAGGKTAPVAEVGNLLTSLFKR